MDGRATRPVVDPSTGEKIAELPCANSDDLERALQSSQRAFEIWRNTPALDRSRILNAAALRLRQQQAEIARTIVMEQGKPLAEAMGEAGGLADLFEWYAGEARRIYGRTIAPRFKSNRQIVSPEPIGPVAAFSPWNFPVVTAGRKIATCLAAGCTCIIKPPENTPASPLMIAAALQEAGLPAGALNVVYGDPEAISRALILSPIVRKITLTGSTVVGRKLSMLAAQGPKPAVMELGGHAPVIVGADADVVRAAKLGAGARFRNAGQVCIAPARFYVHESIKRQFVDAFVAAAKEVKIGNGFEPGVSMGPLATPSGVESTEALIKDAVANGARLAFGGKRIGNKGFFFEPSVLTDVSNDARIMNEEPFGPVAVVNSFQTTDEVVKSANRLPYGLASYVFGNQHSFIDDVADRIEAGIVGVNHFAVSLPETPIGGVKESGYGYEGGAEGIDAFLVRKFISYGASS
ncbi:MAG: NAD-dependent succinate-semialdehyde dehydrogenase [Hyphomicrobiaceae bacterium]